MVAGEGFEPSKAEPGDLQSPPIGRSGNPPGLFVKQPANSSEGLTLGSNRSQVEGLSGRSIEL